VVLRHINDATSFTLKRVFFVVPLRIAFGDHSAISGKLLRPVGDETDILVPA